MELLNNIWFKHFVATWTQEKRLAEQSLRTLPLNTLGNITAALQTRGDGNTFFRCANEAYTKHEELINKLKEQQDERDSGNGTNERTSDGDVE